MNKVNIQPNTGQKESINQRTERQNPKVNSNRKSFIDKKLISVIDNSYHKLVSGKSNKQTLCKSHKVKKNTIENLVIALLNIRSIRNKMDELEIYVNNLVKKPHIIIITETWLKSQEIQFFNIKHYETIGNCRESTRGGGILFFIRDDIKFNLI